METNKHTEIKKEVTKILEDAILHEDILEVINEETSRNGNSSGDNFLVTQLNYNGQNKNYGKSKTNI